MDNKKFIGAVTVAIIFLIIAFAYNKNQTKIQIQDSRQDIIKQETSRPTETINVKYQHKNGRNIFVGSIMLPTPCHTLTSTIAPKGDTHEIVLVTKASNEVCAQVLTEKMFKVELAGSPDDEFIATLNGEVVNLNIFEIPSSDDIDKIEIFIKG